MRWKKKQQLEVPRTTNAKISNSDAHTHNAVERVAYATNDNDNIYVLYSVPNKIFGFCVICVDFNTISVMGCLLHYGHSRQHIDVVTSTIHIQTNFVQISKLMRKHIVHTQTARTST